MTTRLIGARLKALRTERKLSQADLAQVFGFKDRQTVSAIETGARRLTADELVLAVERLKVPLDYFTDPFRLVGEGRFSWRHTDAGARQLRDCEREAGRWIGAFRTLAPQVGRAAPLMRRTLGLDRYSRFEDATLAGERFAADFRLGKTPATSLIDVMERELGILVLMIDARKGISGAACRLPELDTILIARHEVEGCRHFDLAHELFHVLTWDAMPPKHSEAAQETGGNRVEKLANCFAAAVLIPSSALERFGGGWENLTGPDLTMRLNAVADRLRVTSSALRWRLVTLGKIKRDVARSLPEAALRHNGHEAVDDTTPALFSRRFVEVLGLAIKSGHVSTRRAASLLGQTVEDLADLFAAHNIEPPADL